MSRDVNLPEDQFLLRVKRGSEIEQMLRTANGGASLEQLEEAMGNKNGRWLYSRFDRWFDNIASNRSDDVVDMSYTSVLPNQVQVVTSDVTFNGNTSQSQQAQPQELEPVFRWPIAPPLIEPMENFDKPKWFDKMKMMVNIGRHISIEGPPSVGKDTAVEQLASQEGVPLVSIGGDGGFRTRDLIGDQQLVGGTSFYNVGEYVTAAINGWWVLLTEVNAADPSALMYINRQLAAPYVVNLGGKAYPVHPNFRLFVTYNHGLVGTKPLPQSFKDRFFSIKESFFTEAQLRKRLDAMGWSQEPKFEMANSIIVQFGLNMWDAYERGQMRYQITTRRLKDAIDMMVVGDYPAEDALKDAVISAIDSPVEAKAAEAVLKSTLQRTW